MIRIPRSQITNRQQFDTAVARYKQELSDWTTHQRQVEADARNDKLKPAERHAYYPPPSAPDLIVQAQGGYEIYDDGPTPEEALTIKKKQLNEQLTDAEQVASSAVVSPSKFLLNTMKAQKIIGDDIQRAGDIARKRQGLFNKMKAMYKSPTLSAQQEALQARPTADATFMNLHDDMKAKLDKIRLTALQARSDIEDLTVQTVGSYQLPKLGA
jgi:hypothetical protein